MKIDRLKFLANLGEIATVEEPSGDSGGGSAPEGTGEESSEKSSEKEESSDEKEISAGDADEDGDDDSEEDGFKPITSKDEFDRILGKRLHRERAKFADYSDLKQKVEDLTAANAKLSEDLSAESHKSLVARVAKDTGVSEEDLRGSTEEDLRASAQRYNDSVEAAVAARLGQGKSGRSPYTGTGGERPPEPSTQTGRERARAAAQ